MAEDPTTDPEVQNDPQGGGDPQLRGAAYDSALAKERKARKDAERARKDLEDRLQALEDAQLSETERFRKEAEKANARAQAAEEREQRNLAARERGDMIRRAAKDFADPEDAIALLQARGDIDGIEDDKDAERAIKALAKEKPHLVKQATAASGLEQVLSNGDPAPDAATKALQEQAQAALEAQKGLLSADDLWKVAQADEANGIAALREKDPERYWASLAAMDKKDTLAHVRRSAAAR